MRRGAKPTKAKVEADPAVCRKSPMNEASRRQLEGHLVIVYPGPPASPALVLRRDDALGFGLPGPEEPQDLAARPARSLAGRRSGQRQVLF